MDTGRIFNGGHFQFPSKIKSTGFTDLRSIYIANKAAVDAFTESSVVENITNGAFAKKCMSARFAELKMLEEKKGTLLNDYDKFTSIVQGVEVVGGKNLDPEDISFNKFMALNHFANYSKEYNATSSLIANLKYDHRIPARFLSLIHPLIGSGFQFFGRWIMTDLAAKKKIIPVVDGDMGLFIAGIVAMDYATHLYKMAKLNYPHDKEYSDIRDFFNRNTLTEGMFMAMIRSLGYNSSTDLVLKPADQLNLYACFMNITVSEVSGAARRVVNCRSHIINAMFTPAIIAAYEKGDISDGAAGEASDDSDSPGDEPGSDPKSAGKSGRGGKGY